MPPISVAQVAVESGITVRTHLQPGAAVAVPDATMNLRGSASTLKWRYPSAQICRTSGRNDATTNQRFLASVPVGELLEASHRLKGCASFGLKR
jgi:hypothetical protein